MTYARIGKYNATDPTLGDGETTFIRTNVKGEPIVSLSGSKAKASSYEALTIDATAGGIACTALKYAGCTKAFMTLETAQIRYTVDGTAPTAAVGHLLEVGDVLKLDSAEDIAAFRGFRTGAVSGSLRVTYSA